MSRSRVAALTAAALCVLVAGSCAVSHPGWDVTLDEGGLAQYYPPMPDEAVLVIAGKARLDLPKYRVRGTCRIARYPSGELRIDFVHSSLFGSYREDATLYISDSGIVIRDNERGGFWDSDSTLASLRRHFGMEVRPDDISYCLLFDSPLLTGDRTGPGGGTGTGNWRSEGDWRGRHVILEGRAGSGPVSFRQCVDNENICYIMRYDYDSPGASSWYPQKMVLEREYGPERISLTVVSVQEDTLTAGLSR